jgi:hypothetical protein
MRCRICPDVKGVDKAGDDVSQYVVNQLEGPINHITGNKTTGEHHGKKDKTKTSAVSRRLELFYFPQPLNVSCYSCAVPKEEIACLMWRS